MQVRRNVTINARWKLTCAFQTRTSAETTQTNTKQQTYLSSNTPSMGSRKVYKTKVAKSHKQTLRVSPGRSNFWVRDGRKVKFSIWVARGSCFADTGTKFANVLIDVSCVCCAFAACFQPTPAIGKQKAGKYSKHRQTIVLLLFLLIFGGFGGQESAREHIRVDWPEYRRILSRETLGK